jgi:formylglycine-generating enzyme required for sulfatase activity
MPKFRLSSVALCCVVAGIIVSSGGTVQLAGAYATAAGTSRAIRRSPTPANDPAQTVLAEIDPGAPPDVAAVISVGTGGVRTTQQCAFMVGLDDPNSAGALRELEPDFLSFQANQPTICSDEDLADSQAYAVPISGEPITLMPFRFTDNDLHQQHSAVTLPLQAYMQPGYWKFGIRQPLAVELWVKIPVPTQPFFMRGLGDTSLVGGFKPGEMVKAIAYTFQPNADNGVWVYAGVVTFQVARNGYRLLAVPNSHDISFVLIGQQHTFVLANARFDNNGTTSLPSREQQDALYRAFWGDNTGGNGVEATVAPPANVQTRADGKGITQVQVPAGCFLMGSNAPRDLSGQIKDQTQRQVCLTDSYWIDQYEVSNADYQQFIAAGGYQTQDYWSAEGWQWLQDNNRQGPTDYRGTTDPDQPRVGVSLFEAQAYAQWRGGRLPTEAEWEYAARGPQSLLYPWGNSFQDGLANVKGVVGRPVSVQSYPSGQSWVGAFNLAGNVGEWVSDCYDSAYDNSMVKDNPVGPCNGSNEMVKGSSFAFNQFPAQANYRFVNQPLKYWFDVGIRVMSK